MARRRGKILDGFPFFMGVPVDRTSPEGNGEEVSGRATEVGATVLESRGKVREWGTESLSEFKFIMSKSTSEHLERNASSRDLDMRHASSALVLAVCVDSSSFASRGLHRIPLGSY